MKTNKYFLMSIFALLACSCQDDEQGSIQPTPGQEVAFGASLEQNVSTRTIYGEEANGAFPIYWVDGDEVLVSSPECAANGGVGSATYKVNVGGNTTQNYATSLDKTGEIGVRWGNNGSGNFYSIYPVSSSHTKLGSDYKTVTLTMPAQQDNNIVTENGTKIIRSDMRSCFMYAATAGVNSGETVNLKYKPLSTAIRFTLTGPDSDDPVTINYVRIYAPQGTYISGTFNVDLSTATGNNWPTMTVTNGRNYVTMNAADATTGAYLTLGQNESIEMNAFLMIAQETEITDKWYIEIGTSSGISYKKYLDALSGGNRTLVPGMVHRLPKLPSLSAPGAWNPANWMTNLQKNVYLSEISIPGSWNTLNNEYQPDNVTIDNQYNKGVRAFHLDTRWIRHVIGDNELGIADGGATVDALDGSGKYMIAGAPTFENSLKTIVKNAKRDEYMVVVCTFAQGSTNYQYATGKYWLHKISEICNSINDNSDPDYYNKIVDARELTPNSVVADVLGKVIVIVNTYTPSNIDDSKCLFMNLRMELDETDFKPNLYQVRDLKYYNYMDTNIDMYATHAQLTKDDQTSENGDPDSGRGYVPTLLERKNKVENILNKSKENHGNFANYAHDAWMYIGLGGYVDGDNITPVRDYFSNWFGNKLTEMSTGGYYPVGIVLLNDVASSNVPTSGISLVHTILEMNNKYRKAYDPNRSPVDGSYIDGSGSSTNSVQSAAPGYSSGMTDNNTDAIGWTRCR